MPKWSSYLTRFVLLLIICVLVISVFAFGLSSYFFSQATRDAEFAILKNNVQSASYLLKAYNQGEMTREEMKAVCRGRGMEEREEQSLNCLCQNTEPKIRLTLRACKIKTM